MVDHVSQAKRSDIMRQVRAKDTAPERLIRSAAHRLGLRFRLYRRDLPGTPDLVFPKARVALFVHGCFWHRHAGCAKATTPKSNTEFWSEKFRRNVLRDQVKMQELSNLGWRTVIIWQCEVPSLDRACRVLEARLFPLLGKQVTCEDSSTREPPEGIAKR